MIARTPLIRDYGRRHYVTRRDLRRHHGPITQWLRHVALMLGLI